MSSTPALNLALPGNPRYQPKQLQPWFGYDNLYRSLGQVEIAVLQVLGEIGVIPPEVSSCLTPQVIEALLNIRTTEVDEVERTITKHDVRAWVRIAQGIVGEQLAPWVHVPLTSYEAIETARAFQFREAYQQALRPALTDGIKTLVALVKRNYATLQIGRTHGQHALPITVGFWLATILSRLVYNFEEMERTSARLVGKISGAVGAYNAQVALGFNEKSGRGQSFEDRVLRKLGLEPALISTQILPPEPLSYFLYACLMMIATLGQLGRDCRHLMRSEIAEIGEPFEEGQVGSSTMAHKRNPINFEQLEGMFIRSKNEFGKVLDALISEHQRDLVGSSVSRDFPIILVNLMQQLNTLLRRDRLGVPFLGRISVDVEATQRNFEASSHLILAEPLYIALQMAGFGGDAHELLNSWVVPAATRTGRPLINVLEDLSETDEVIAKALENIPPHLRNLFYFPENYIGLARKKAQEVVGVAESLLTRLNLG